MFIKSNIRLRMSIRTGNYAPGLWQLSQFGMEKE
jgi:hypothetical protein